MLSPWNERCTNKYSKSEWEKVNKLFCEYALKYKGEHKNIFESIIITAIAGNRSINK